MDLMRLRDIASPSDDEAPFTLSPDGRRLAVAVREAVVEANSYCTRLLVVDLGKRAVRQIVQIDGNVILDDGNVEGKLADLGSGAIRPLIARWAPGGEQLAYLEKRGGVAQIMVVDVGASGSSRQLTHSATDVQRFGWSEDGTQIAYVTRPEAIARETALEEEGKKGFRYDDRWVPLRKFRPHALVAPLQGFSLDVATGETRAVPAHEVDATSHQGAKGADGSEAAIRPRDPAFVNSPGVIYFRKGGKEFLCRTQSCAKALRVWLRPRSDEVLFLRHSGWSDSESQIVSWKPHSDTFRVLLKTQDNIEGCRAGPDALVCAIDGTLQPRRLERLDYRTGRRSVLFDPNPDWRNKEQARVTPLRWRNAMALECFAKLILPPPEKTPPGKLPLVIVGYQNRGFARGGSGDYFPILPFAAAGYAVLYYHLPPSIGLSRPARSWSEANRRGMETLADYHSFKSALDTILERLVQQGVVDPRRIGLTGFSAGTQRGAFLLAQGDRFAAASFMGCCGGPISRDLLVGPQFAKYYRELGYPSLRDKAADLARNDFDLGANAERVSTPILVQSPDREFLGSLAIFDEFERRNKSFHLFVYPDEYHVFWQPVHRLSVYARNLEWFENRLRNRPHSWAHRYLFNETVNFTSGPTAPRL